MKKEYEYFLNEINSYVDYFAYLLLGTLVAEKYFPKAEKKDCFFHKFLMSCTTTYAGALLGSYIYNLNYSQSDDDSEDESDSDSDSGIGVE